MITRKARKSRSSAKGAANAPVWEFSLYIAGQTPQTALVVANLDRLCRGVLGGHCRVEVVDLRIDPDRARHDNILAVPTLIKRRPGAVKKLVGTLANWQGMRNGLGLSSEEAKAFLA